MKWLTKGTGGNNPHTFDAVDPIVEKSIKYLQEKGFKKIGAVGYCFVSVDLDFDSAYFGVSSGL